MRGQLLLKSVFQAWCYKGCCGPCVIVLCIRCRFSFEGFDVGWEAIKFSNKRFELFDPASQVTSNVFKLVTEVDKEFPNNTVLDKRVSKR